MASIFWAVVSFFFFFGQIELNHLISNRFLFDRLQACFLLGWRHYYESMLSLYIHVIFSPEPPESESISLNPCGPPTEGSEVTLQCFVLNVASAENFAVTFYRGQMPLGHVKANNNRNEPVSETFSLRQCSPVLVWSEAGIWSWSITAPSSGEVR